jgi:hypothetical protein
MQNLQNLEVFTFAKNQLTGGIPSELAKLKKLRTINLNYNSLSGPIPDEIGSLTNLKYLGLIENQLSGLIPDDLGNLTNLEQLYLHSNRFTGSPSSLSKLKNTVKVLFPNPMSTIPYDVFAESPSDSLSQANWTTFLSIKPSNLLRKRQGTSAMTTEELLSMCPLNKVNDASVPAGCLTGIYNRFCIDAKDNFTDCQSRYDTVIGNSFFQPLLQCAAWKKGKQSQDCLIAIATFYVKLDYGILTKTHATEFVTTFFGKPNEITSKYAPCVNTETVTCRR